LAGAWKRFMAGMPLVMTQSKGPGRIAFSKDKPGELIALPLAPGDSVDVREHVFMVATDQISYDWFDSQIWYRVENNLHYPIGRYLDRFTAKGEPGLLLLHGGGNVFTRALGPSETILVKPTALLFKSPTVGMQMLIEHPGGAWRTARIKIWSQRCLWLKLTGPGRVAIQSHYDHWHDPNEPVRSMPANARIVDW